MWCARQQTGPNNNIMCQNEQGFESSLSRNGTSWQYKYPNGWDFTLYSNRHSSYSRIDLLFTPKVKTHRKIYCKILPNWKLNTSLINDATFVESVEKELNTYFEVNTNPGTSQLILCAKAHLQSLIIALSCAKKKERDWTEETASFLCGIEDQNR